MKTSLRYNLSRIELVEAMIQASNCYQTSLCSCDLCANLIHVANRCGVDFQSQNSKSLTHTRTDLITSEQKFVFRFLSDQLQFQLYNRSNIFDGMMELPKELTPAYRFYEENRQKPGQNHSTLIRQTVFILVSAALPDSYLSAIEKNHIIDFLNLPKSITNDIVNGQYWTSHFGEDGCFAPIAGYGLEFGFDGKEPKPTERIGLKEYVELWPSIPDYFSWWDRTNQAGTCGGFVVRSMGLLISQQWAFPHQNDTYIQIFNRYMAPMLSAEPTNEFDRIIVVFSTYRKRAYIASTDPRSWNLSTPNRNVHLPLPVGYGLVGNWRSSESDYVPPSLRSFDSDMYTPLLRAAAQYLEECLRIDDDQRRNRR